MEEFWIGLVTATAFLFIEILIVIMILGLVDLLFV